MAVPTFDIEFTREGRVFDTAQVDRLITGLDGVSDLLVLCHGWNNDLQEAKGLYDGLLANFEKVRGLDGPDGRTFAACWVLWPSKRFTDEELIPGGGAVSAHAANDASLDAILDALANEPERLPADAAAASRKEGSTVRRTLVEQAKTLARNLDADDNRDKYVAVLRSLLDPSHASSDDASD